jgi:hypothetical protein
VVDFLIAFQVGTPICVSVPSKDPICVSVPSKDRRENIIHSLGRISSIQTSNGSQIFSARNGLVSIKVCISESIRDDYCYANCKLDVQKLTNAITFTR